MSDHPNERIFRLNDKVREVLRRRITELEDFCVSVAIQAYKEIIDTEPGDPFEFLKDVELPENKSVCIENPTDNAYIDDNVDSEYDTDEEEVSVTTRIFNGVVYYTFIDDEGNDLCGVHERIIADDNESEVGDLVGYVDTEDRFWEAIKANGNIEEYSHDGVIVPALKDTIMRYPDLDSLKKDR